MQWCNNATSLDLPDKWCTYTVAESIEVEILQLWCVVTSHLHGKHNSKHDLFTPVTSQQHLLHTTSQLHITFFIPTH